MDFNTTGHKQRKGERPGRSGVAGLRLVGVGGRVWGGDVEGCAGEESIGIH